MARLFAVVVLVVLAVVPAARAEVQFTEDERAVVLAFGPWPPKWIPDPSNRVSGNAAAAAFGERLFFERRLSKGAKISCGDCHRPEMTFADGVALNRGHGPLHRNTPSVANLRWAHWFGWGGEADNLWAQSIRPIIAPPEMAMTPETVRAAVADDKDMACRYAELFGAPANAADSEDILVNIGKALAAYQETLVSGRAPFDEFRDAMARNDRDAMQAYSEAAQRGLKIFAGSGRCHFCHFGPQFTNGEFGDVGVPYFIAKGRVDKGRYGGIQAHRNSPFNLLGRHNDDPSGRAATRSRHVALQHRNWGEFKVPSLRNVAETAPYMHNGSVEDLDAVIDFYSELNEERLHTDGERILRPLNLTDRQKADLKAFLVSLSAPVRQIPLPGAPAASDCRK